MKIRTLLFSLVLAVAALSSAACASGAASPAILTPRQALNFVCADLHEGAACKYLPLPSIVINESIGAVMHEGAIGGVLGEYNPQADIIFLDPLLQYSPVLFDSTLVHEMAHYVDNHDGTPITDPCATEVVAHKAQHDWLFIHGYAKLAKADEGWRKWYGCK